MIHHLKILPLYFDSVASGIKTFEVRKFDKVYQIGDILILHEFDGFKYSGRLIRAKVTYILSDPSYVKDSFVILGIILLEV